jgi:hypothetical protein
MKRIIDGKHASHPVLCSSRVKRRFMCPKHRLLNTVGLK